MDTADFDRLTRTISAMLSRRTFSSALALGAVAFPEVADAKKKKHKKHKKHKKKHGCKTECCADADCEPLFLCAQGACVMGQGSCAPGTDGCATSSNICGGFTSEEPCSCFQSTVGETRCAAGVNLPGFTCGECVNDDDCRELYSDIPGVFCARGGPNCGCPNPNSGFCQGPCADAG